MDKTLFPMITEDDKKLPFYLTSVGVRENQEHVRRLEGFPGFHWLHSAKGRGQLNIAGKDFLIRENMGFFFRPGIPHEYFAVEELWETHWLTFDGFAVSGLLEALGVNEWDVFYLKNRISLDKMLSEIYTTGNSKNSDRSYDCSSFIYRFMLLYKKLASRDPLSVKLPVHQQLEPVIDFIENNFNKDTSIEEMSRIIGVTPQHLCRLFRKHYCMRPFEYLTRYRLQKAKEIIISPEEPTVKEVSRRAGYNDTSYFCAVFKEYEGISPNEFKKIYRKG